MTEELQKAVESGKLSSAAATALARLTPGTFVLHKSWGYGKIAGHDFLLNQTTIDFKTKKGHSMQLQYAAESLVALAEDHIAAKKYVDLDAIKTLAQKDAAALVRTILQSVGGRATQEQIYQNLVPDVFAEPGFKKWWENAKKALKADPLVGVPQKKTDPYVLRAEALSQSDEMLTSFKAARTLKEQILALDGLTKNLASFTDTVALQGVVTSIEDAAKKSVKLKTAEALSLLVSRDEIVAKFPAVAKGADSLSVAYILTEEEKTSCRCSRNFPFPSLSASCSRCPRRFRTTGASRP